MTHDTSNVRVRFAPSPTGYLHVGGARTAIFNWLWARHTGGTFVLRIEDTDAERSTGESEVSLIEDLRWLGLDWDEGPHKGGDYAPYRQSERLDVYREIVDTFLAAKHAYPCFCTDEELEAKRKQAMAESRAPQYDGTCRSLSADDITARRNAGTPEVVRFKVPAGKAVFDDVVRGPMELDTNMVGDFVIMRSNGLPTYNFAAAVDDARMAITHVIRGEEHLSNTLRQILIYDAMGAAHPTFVHVPLILAEDRSKLSKRHGASSVGELRSQGYLSSAAVNYLVLLGWSHPESKEVMTPEEMTAAFTIDRIGKAAAVFDRQKLAWMNGQHIRKLDTDTLFELAAPHLPSYITDRYNEATCREIVAILQDSIETLEGLDQLAAGFNEAVEYEQEARDVLATDAAADVLTGLKAALAGDASDLTPEQFKAAVKTVGKDVGRRGKELFFPIRAAVTGSVHGPDLSRVCAVKGRASVIAAIDQALSRSGA